jgi:hypothetical protein
MQKKTEQNTTSELDQIIASLTPEQLRFVVARQDYSSDKETAEELEIPSKTVYNWPNKAEVNRAIKLMADDIFSTARSIRKKHLAEAMMVKVKGLRSKNERIAQAVATEFVEWELGKANQPLTGKDGGAIPIVITQLPLDEL